jgi:CheY-like chemotaxis protein
MTSLLELPRLVLVEDSDEDAETVCEAFRRSGAAANLQRVTSGDECMELLRRPGMRQPGLILMDLNTPGMDGRQALHLIKSDETLKSIPVVVVSTSGNSRDIDFCYDAGANAYHVKPVRYPEHLSTMVGVFDYWLGVISQPARKLSNP